MKRRKMKTMQKVMQDSNIRYLLMYLLYVRKGILSCTVKFVRANLNFESKCSCII